MIRLVTLHFEVGSVNYTRDSHEGRRLESLQNPFPRLFLAWIHRKNCKGDTVIRETYRQAFVDTDTPPRICSLAEQESFFHTHCWWKFTRSHREEHEKSNKPESMRLINHTKVIYECKVCKSQSCTPTTAIVRDIMEPSSPFLHHSLFHPLGKWFSKDNSRFHKSTKLQPLC